jgi:hypothetical protein
MDRWLTFAHQTYSHLITPINRFDTELLDLIKSAQTSDHKPGNMDQAACLCHPLCRLNWYQAMPRMRAIFALSVLSLSSLVSAALRSISGLNGQSTSNIPNTYIVELQSTIDISSFGESVKRAIFDPHDALYHSLKTRDVDFDVGKEWSSDLWTAVSLKLDMSAASDDA